MAAKETPRLYDEIPPEVIMAAETTGRWFEARNLQGWKLGPCACRFAAANTEKDRAELIAALRGVEKAWTETATNDKPALRSPLYDAMNRARSLLARMVP